jgi:hypothetical protein
MIDLAIVVIVLGVAVVASEVSLGGRKVQSSLASLVKVWGIIGVAIMGHFFMARGGGALVFGVFWAGAFLTWFGVRSHIESSILLRMVHLLRAQERRGDELVAAYDALYGPGERREELFRSGLAEPAPEGVRLTPKGKRILGAAEWLA